jgi:3-hydroxyisobutyrate dehydrogenase-like beta-hydroxyacid dehydrogenase
MGQAMAWSLHRAGHRLVVYNRSHEKTEPFRAKGVAVAGRPEEACRGDAVITMLSDDAAAASVVFENGGILGALRPGAAHLSMSTISPELSDRLTQAHAQARQVYLAAPVFGRPEAAAAAKLFIIAAGDGAAIERHRALFDAMGQRTFVAGERPSAANTVKLAGNFLIAAMLECLGESFALIRKSEIDAHRYLEILTSTLFSAPVYKTYGTIIADEAFMPPGFRLRLGLKDIRLALAAAEAKAVPMPVASLVRDHFIAGIAQGDGDADWSALARVTARNAGL